MDPEDEDIIPAGAVQVPGTPAPEVQVEEGATEPNAEANPETDASATEQSEAGTYTIDGVEYTEEELDQVLRKGKSLHEYQKAHPGFDPWLLERDYRAKTGELAELKRAGAVPAKPTEPEADLSEFEPEELARFDKIAKAKGLLTKTEVEAQERARKQTAYATERDRQRDVFLKAHPEYMPENDPGDVKWSTFLKEYKLYVEPANPSDIGSLLERAHQAVSGGAGKGPAPKDVRQLLAARKTTKVAATSAGGTNGGGSAAPKDAAKSEKIARLRQHLKGFSDEEINNMAK